MTAWISPARRSRFTPSQAVTAPNCLVSPWVARTGSVMGCRPPRQQTNDPAPGEQDHCKQQQAEINVPELRKLAEEMFERYEKRRPRHRPAEPADTAEDDQHDDFTTGLPAEHRGTDEPVQIGKQGPGQPGYGSGDDESHQPQAEWTEAYRFDPPWRLPCRAEGQAERGLRQPCVEPERQ